MRIERIDPVLPRPGGWATKTPPAARRGFTLSREHRDALYDYVLGFLFRFDDLRDACERENPDPATCDRVGRGIRDGLRLIQDAGLGWGGSVDGGQVELKLPPDELIPLFERLRADIVVSAESVRAGDDGGGREWELIERARRACDQALRGLGRGPNQAMRPASL
jgi:hypothetical protein